MTTTQDLAQTLAQTHQAMAAGVRQEYATALHATDVALPMEQAAVLQACRMLGFIETDAQCVARAWQHQTQRLGHFDVAAWPDQPVDFGLQQSPRDAAFPPCPARLGLYAVLPDAAWVGRMAQAGVPTVQLRFKSEDPHAIQREVEQAVRAVEGTSSLLFINDHWAAAIDAGAYGLHLGQEDLADAPLDTIRAAGLHLGVSTHGYTEMMVADRVAPSYLALGAVFPTTLKRMATAPQGLGRLQAYARLMKAYPLVAIGGIDLESMPAVVATGVGSVAVVRAITGSEHPEESAKKLIQLLS